MWVKVDDGFPEHPKVREAGRHLGTYGRGRVIAVWQVAMCYCNRNLTDGFIDEATVRTWTLFDRRPLDVALVMAQAGLLVRVEGGFRFHDYDDYQPSAAEVKAKKKKDRDRKREERKRKLGVQPSVHEDVHADNSAPSAWNPARSRARDPDPGPSHQKDHGRAARAGCGNPVENERVLKALIWREVHAAYGDRTAEFTLPEVTERAKVVAARAGLLYATDFFHEQIGIAFDRVPKQRRRSAA
jgi:hypothetical protein